MVVDPDYRIRRTRPFEPTSAKFSDIQAAIPPHLRSKKLGRALIYVARDITFSVILFYLANHINSNAVKKKPFLIQGPLWVCYWYWQSIAWTGFWCLGV